jgi:hypothetical protein
MATCQCARACSACCATALNRRWTASIDYNIDLGKHDGTIARVWLTKPVVHIVPSGNIGNIGGTLTP